MINEDLMIKYINYFKDWCENHDLIPNSSEPACFNEWYQNEYEEEKDLSKEYVYRSGYTKDQVIDVLVNHFEYMGEIEDSCEFEKNLIKLSDSYYDRLSEDLEDWCDFPNWDSFEESVIKVFDSMYEISKDNIFSKDLTI